MKLDEDALLTVDGKRVVDIILDAGELRLVYEDGYEYVSPATLWYGVVGDGVAPTAAEAGRLLADCIASRLDLERLRAGMSALIEGAPARPAFVPEPRLDPFVEEALARCEQNPTPEKVAALAAVLNLETARIVELLRQRGKAVVQPDPLPDIAVPVEIAPVDTDTVKPRRRGNRHSPDAFTWNEERRAILREAFLAAPKEQKVAQFCAQFAEKQGWPARAVEYQVYHLKLPSQRLAQSAAESS